MRLNTNSWIQYAGFPAEMDRLVFTNQTHLVCLQYFLFFPISLKT